MMIQKKGLKSEKKEKTNLSLEMEDGEEWIKREMIVFIWWWTIQSNSVLPNFVREAISRFDTSLCNNYYSGQRREKSIHMATIATPTSFTLCGFIPTSFPTKLKHFPVF